MLKVLTAAQMREVDRLTTERYGIPSILLMENAAHAVARVITEKLGGSVKDRVIVLFCGPGNNGGDGAALARILWEQGADCFPYLVGDLEQLKGDARTNFEMLERFYESEEMNGPNDNCVLLKTLEDQASVFRIVTEGREVDCVVDALFGTGLSRAVEGRFEQLIRDLNLAKRQLRNTLYLSIDIPSGVNADEPEMIGEAVRPDVTVTFTAPKTANVLPPASSSQGDLHIESIGTPLGLVDNQPSDLHLCERADARRWLHLSSFTNASYKNKRGHALIIGGSRDYSGAAVLCGDAAIRSGCGLVTVATPESSWESIVARVSPEVMVRGISQTAEGSAAEKAADEIAEFLKNVDAIAIGSGLSSKDEETKRFVHRIVEERQTPVVIDADGLTALSPWSANGPRGVGDEGDAGETSAFPSRPLILTPHEGEFKRLLGVEGEEANEALKDRVQAVRDFATTFKVILVLKGERALIGAPDGRVVVNPTGNSGLGKAGNGDTLTGIITGFVAQATQMKIDIFETVVAAVYVAGMAGDVAEKKYGKRVMTASDVRDCLVEVFADLTSE